MPSRKTSVFIPEEIIAGLHLPDREATREDGDRVASMSGRVNQILAQFARVVDASLPPLTHDEWCAVFYANNGTMIGEEPSFSMVWANVADFRDLAQAWDVDQGKLVEKLRGLSVPQQAAVIEMIERFWANPQVETDELLRKIGLGLVVAKGKNGKRLGIEEPSCGPK